MKLVVKNLQKIKSECVGKLQKYIVFRRFKLLLLDEPVVVTGAKCK